MAERPHPVFTLGGLGCRWLAPATLDQVQPADLVKFGHVKPVWVGLHGRTVASREEEGRPKGFRVRSVDPGSPAEKAGIKPGDQILSVDATAIDSPEAFETALSTRGPGRLCTWKQANRILAGFGDGQAADGPSAGPASLVGLKLAKERGWKAPEGAK